MRAAGRNPTALSLSATDWNLVVACDMPNLTAASLRALLEQAASSRTNCVMAAGASGEPEPLCAAYHRRCLPVLDRAIRDKRFKMKDLVSELGAELVATPSGALENVNTPTEWSQFQ